MANTNTPMFTSPIIKKQLTYQQSITLRGYVWDKTNETITVYVRGVKDSKITYGNFELSDHLLLSEAVQNMTVDVFWLETLHKKYPILDKVNCDPVAAVATTA